jgi:hypothetical protein
MASNEVIQASGHQFIKHVFGKCASRGTFGLQMPATGRRRFSGDKCRNHRIAWSADKIAIMCKAGGKSFARGQTHTFSTHWHTPEIKRPGEQPGRKRLESSALAEVMHTSSQGGGAYFILGYRLVALGWLIRG